MAIQAPTGNGRCASRWSTDLSGRQGLRSKNVIHPYPDFLSVARVDLDPSSSPTLSPLVFPIDFFVPDIVAHCYQYASQGEALAHIYFELS